MFLCSKSSQTNYCRNSKIIKQYFVTNDRIQHIDQYLKAYLPEEQYKKQFARNYSNNYFMLTVEYKVLFYQ